MKTETLYRIFFLILICMSITGCTKNSVKTPDIDGYKLLWSDEFNGKKLNTEIWNYETHQPGWTNNELQEYTASEENIFVRDGNLIIKAKKEKNPTGGFHYTSGKITTQDKQDFTYGKIIARAKVPVGKGNHSGNYLRKAPKTKQMAAGPKDGN